MQPQVCLHASLGVKQGTEWVMPSQGHLPFVGQICERSEVVKYKQKKICCYYYRAVWKYMFKQTVHEAKLLTLN